MELDPLVVAGGVYTAQHVQHMCFTAPYPKVICIRKSFYISNSSKYVAFNKEEEEQQPVKKLLSKPNCYNNSLLPSSDVILELRVTFHSISEFCQLIQPVHELWHLFLVEVDPFENFHVSPGDL